MQREGINGLLMAYAQRYWGFIALAAWGGVVLGVDLVRFSTAHLDESSARALLLTWSLVQSIATPIPIAGLPDLRAMLLIPAAIYWPGSLVAAKVFSLLVGFGAASLLYRWSSRTAGRETALIASALLLICPLTLKQIDAIGAGPFLLLAFGLSGILDRRYRASKRLFGGWYFSQMLLVAFCVSLHPAGLAYPLSLAWGWLREPLERRHQIFLYIGLVLACLFVPMFHVGWVAPQWLIDPLAPLSGMFSGLPTGMAHTPRLIGLVPGLLLLFLLALDYRLLTTDLVGRTLLLATLGGLAMADSAWAVVALSLLLYRGTYFLILLNEKVAPGFLGQRGIVMLCLFLLATFFMVADKTYARVIRTPILTPQDRLIQSLAEDYADPKHPIHVASQWPGRTMIVCKCYVLPLPPAARDGATLVKNLGVVSYLVFDHKDPANRPLEKNLSELSGVAETLQVTYGGVIVKIHPQTEEQAPAAQQPDR
jgi:hypothetical protein